MPTQRIRRGSRKGQFAPKGYYTHDESVNLVPKGSGLASKIAIAATGNRIVVITYRKKDGTRQLYKVEPYSYRLKGDEPHLFAFDVDSETIKSFAVRKISNVRVQAERFSPRWEVEIQSTEPTGESWPSSRRSPGISKSRGR